MDSSAEACRQAGYELCRARMRKVDWWFDSKQAALFPPCDRFRRAYLAGDRATLGRLQAYLDRGQCLCCGYTLLHLAVSVTSKQLLVCYLSRNPDVEARTDNGETALHLACAGQDPWFVEQLLVNRADASATDGLGCTSLQICLSRRLAATSILQLLLDHGTRPNRLFGAGAGGLDPVGRLLRANARSPSGRFALYEAVRSGDHARTRALLEDGACPSSLKCYRPSLLQVACFGQSVLCAKALLEAGADVNESDLEERTALHYAVIGNSGELVELLALHRCDLWARDSGGYTAFGLAALTNRLMASSALLAHGASYTEDLVIEALKRQCTDVVLLLLCHCPFEVRRTRFGKALLYCAVATGQQRVVDYLQRLGVEVPYEGSEDEEAPLLPRKPHLLPGTDALCCRPSEDSTLQLDCSNDATQQTRLH